MATALMPSSLQAQMTRRAISPRFATRIFLNMNMTCRARSRPLLLANAEDWHAVLDGAAVVDEHLRDYPGNLSFDLVHQLHGFNDAQHLPLFHRIAYLHEWRCAG